MSIPSYILRIAHPIKESSSIFPCSKKICLCVEYLNFGNADHVNIYKHCMITDYLNEKRPHPRTFKNKTKDSHSMLPK